VKISGPLIEGSVSRYEGKGKSSRGETPSSPVVCDIADLALMAISLGPRVQGSARRTKDQAPGDFDGVNNKDVNAFVPVKTASFLWGQRSSVPSSPAKGFSA
jgi:hypothetical protein